MTKRTTTGALLVIGALVAAACGDGVLPSGPDLDAQFARGGNKASKADVCHVDDEGNVKKINVNGNALSAHLGHGDGTPGDGEYDADCQTNTVPFVCEVEFTSATIALTGATATFTFSANATGGVTYTAQWLLGTEWQSGPSVHLDGDVVDGSITGVPPLFFLSFRIQAVCDDGGEPHESVPVLLLPPGPSFP